MEVLGIPIAGARTRRIRARIGPATDDLHVGSMTRGRTGPRFRSPLMLLIALVLAYPAPMLAQTCNPVGYWTATDRYQCTTGEWFCGLLVGGFIKLASDGTGTLKWPYCSETFSLTWSGTTSVHIDAAHSLGQDSCFPYTMDVSLSADCKGLSGIFTNYWGETGPTEWTRNELKVSRSSLTVATAEGVPAQGSRATPSPGSFSYLANNEAGPNPPSVAMSTSNTSTSNPNLLDISARGGMRTPTPGGRSRLVANYVLDYPFISNTTTNDANTFAAFGMSCYIVALESDYGAIPDHCASTRINGIRYTGTVTNPYGLAGTYCSAFIANVKLQGTGQLNNGTYVAYAPSTNTISTVSSVTGADGTAVIAGQTVARDRAIIPGRGVLVDVDGIGTGLLANDTGGAIIGYRLDLFNGAGVAACAGYTNPIFVGVCNPQQTTTCPGSTLQ